MISNVLNFIKEYYSFILLAISFIIDLFIIPLVNKRSKDANALANYSNILKYIPKYIQEAERYLGPKTGVAKLVYVLNKIQLKCAELGVFYDESDYILQVENMLACPAKKEVNNETLESL